jgi:hypothetical protein
MFQSSPREDGKRRKGVKSILEGNELLGSAEDKETARTLVSNVST